jgi:hypothetical protein
MDLDVSTVVTTKSIIGGASFAAKLQILVVLVVGELCKERRKIAFATTWGPSQRLNEYCEN